MKIITTISLLLLSTLLYGQVGIGTTNAQADLDIQGDMLVQSNFKTGALTTVTPTDEDFKLITRVTNGAVVGELKVLDVNLLNVAPVNVIDYQFTNIYLDNVTDVDLQYDTSKYIVGISNFRQVGDAVKKVPSGITNSIGNFVVRAFENGGTWHLEIRNQTLDLDPGDSLEYYVTLVIYNKSYFRHLPSIMTDLGGVNEGSASSVPVIF